MVGDITHENPPKCHEKGLQCHATPIQRAACYTIPENGTATGFARFPILTYQPHGNSVKNTVSGHAWGIGVVLGTVECPRRITNP